MDVAIFCCPECAFRKEISQNDIPPTAKQCICPSCRKTLAVADAITHSQAGELPIQKRAVAKHKPRPQTENDEKRAQDSYQELMENAFSELKEGDDLEAMNLLEKAEKANSTPIARSYLAYCRAKIKYEFSEAIKVCVKTIREEPDNANLYLNLARVYILANKRKPALQTIRKGLKLGPHAELMKEFKKFDRRKPPVFSSLSREHLLNKKAGKIFHRIGLR